MPRRFNLNKCRSPVLKWQRGYRDNIEEGWRRNGVDWWYSPLGRCDGRKLVRGGLRRDAAKYMVNFAVAMVLDAAIRGGMRRVNVRDAACSNYDAALTTLDAAHTTLDAALKILDAAALRLHPTEPAINDQPSIANRHHDNIFKSIPFRTQYEALFGEYLKVILRKPSWRVTCNLNEGTSDAARCGEVHNGAAEYVGDMVKNNFMEAIWRVTCNLNERTSDAARRGEVHSGAAEYVGDMVKNNFMKAIWRVTCNLNERTSDAARRGEVHTGAASVVRRRPGS
ncbi:hypothetical protein C8J57DRAFT_1235509 [Mycena rebaudengoi]|nr:hypothetical protein C8J57DRAFT_1235509 [Mycena rebaudengoi]